MEAFVRRVLGTAAVCALLATLPQLAGAVVVTPANTREALVNPGMGFVFYRNAGRLWAYGCRVPAGDTLDWFPGASTVYFRLLWSELEPEEGVFRWDLIDSFARSWIAAGKQIGIRVICCNQTANATPDFVRAAGAKGNWFTYRRDGKAFGTPKWEPVYDDPVFLAKLERFGRAFAARYDGDPAVAFVDIGSLGIYGEGHTASTTRLSREETERLARIHVALWRKLLPKTQLVISDDVAGSHGTEAEHPLMKWCRELGVGYRDDSIFCMDPTPAPNHPDGSWAHAHWARGFASQSPVVIEHGHVLMCEPRGHWVSERMLACVEKTQASYWSIHHFPDDYLRRYRKEIDAIALRLGYRFELRRAEWPETVKVGEPVAVKSEWTNVGVSWCHRGAYLTWSLLDEKGDVVWSVTDETWNFRGAEPKLDGVEKPVRRESACRFGLTQRNPDPDVVLEAARDAGLDPGPYYRMLPAGTYRLAVSLGSRIGKPEIALPLEGGKNRMYPLGTIRVVEQ